MIRTVTINLWASSEVTNLTSHFADHLILSYADINYYPETHRLDLKY